jgi:hypothetical protein
MDHDEKKIKLTADNLRELIQESLAAHRQKWVRYVDPDGTMPFGQSTYEERLKYIEQHWPEMTNKD